MYVPTSTFHWNWYKNSSTYWEFDHAQPTLGFYDQTQGTTVQLAHYQQLKSAKVDYALVSWFGGINDATTDAAINKVLDAYWSTFTTSNDQTNDVPIRLAILMEYAGTNYQTRLDYLKSSIYDKYPTYVLKYNNQPLIELSFEPMDATKKTAIMQYAQGKGFYIVDSEDAAGGGSIFGGISMKTDDPHRITALFGGVSPSVDISGKEISFEAESVTKGCGTNITDVVASGGVAVQSTGTNCDVVSSGSATAGVPTVAQYLSEWYAIFRVKTADRTTVGGSVSVVDSCGNKYSSPISSNSFSANNDYSNLVVQFSHLNSACTVDARASVTAGSIVVDRIWASAAIFRKPSLAGYDSQWQPIKNLSLSSRPKFITVASFNAWEEGTAIESSSVFGTQFLDRTAYWSDLIRK